jgi:hypothetical protein
MIVTFDQQNIPWLYGFAQFDWIGRRKGLVARRRLLQIRGDKAHHTIK